MKKFIAVILALAVLAVAIMIGYDRWYERTYITIGDRDYRRDITQLDFSGGEVPELGVFTELTDLQKLDLQDTGLTVEEYEWLRQKLPECQILWKIPFQDSFLTGEETALTVTSFTEEDMKRLDYFPNVSKIDAVGCQDLTVLFALKAERPELELLYTVPIGGEGYRETTTELTLENADAEELKNALTYLPLVTDVTFTGTAPENEDIYELMCLHPEITFVWNFEVFGIPVTSLDTQLILNEIPMESVAEVEDSLKYFYDMQWVEMCDTGISTEEMASLQERHPDTRFIWKVNVGKCVLRTDATSFIPYHFGYKNGSKLYDEDIGELKYCIDMVCMDLGHMGISNYDFLNYMPKLQYLILVDTKGTDFSPIANLKELVYLEIFMTKFSQTELLTGLTKLEDLNLAWAKVENIEPLLEMTWLHRLWIPGNYLTHEEIAALKEALPDTIFCFHSAECTDQGWRDSPNYFEMRDLLGMFYMKG